MNRLLMAVAALLMLLIVSLPSFAADVRCDICGMMIHEDGKNHIALKHNSNDPHPLHVCSRSCAHKAQKHDSQLTTVEVTDFNHPQKHLDGQKAFFLVKSEKVKADMDAMTMPPYLAAFATKEEADTAQKKYGDGHVVQGFEKAVDE